MNMLNKLVTAAAVTIAYTGAAIAAPDFSELGNSLTPIGAIQAGNEAGTIPAWDGGLCEPPAGYSPKDRRGGWPYIDPFADEKPLYSITSENMAEYDALLTEGTKVLLTRYPDSHRIDVYPTHRTVCYPDWVYENTIAGAGQARLVGSAPGVADSHARVPFPIPQTGQEAMWNSLLRFHGANETGDFYQYLGDRSGTRTLVDITSSLEDHQYWDNTREGRDDTTFWRLVASIVAPASKAGEKQMRVQYVRADQRSPMAWQYLPGQRRVRMAPEFTYDTISAASGVLLFDEINGFDGKMDKFDFELIGRQEVLVPYNAYRRWNMPSEEAFGSRHVNPDAQRWELHRVWVVEATLKPGERHVQSRKKFYLDEDSWAILAYVGFDQNDNPHHYKENHVYMEYEKPTLRSNSVYDLYDLSTGNRSANGVPGARGTGYVWVDRHPPNTFSPSALSGRGIR